MKILLVDDEQKFGTMLAKQLELRGIQSDYVYTGEEAEKKVKNGERFDIAVLDVKMPGIGGIELKRRLEVLDPEMKFVFLTGHGSTVDKEDSDLRISIYLPKPLNIDILIETLNRIVRKKDNE